MLKKRSAAIILTLMLTAAMIPLCAGTVFADKIISAVKINCDIEKISLSSYYTEDYVRTKILNQIKGETEGVSIDHGNTFLVYWNETYGQIYGTGDGSGLVSEGRRYYLEACLNPWTGYDWPAETKLPGGTEVPISKVPAFTVFFNGEKRTDVLLKYNSSWNKLSVIIPIANDISSGSFDLSAGSFVYDGSEKMPEVGKVALKNGTYLKKSSYSVYCINENGAKAAPVNVGKYFAVVEGKGIYGGTISREFTITQAENTLTVSPLVVKIKAARLAKKKQTVKRAKAVTVTDAQGEVTYKLAKVRKTKFKKYFKVNARTGKITIRKGLKKGKYRLDIKVTAAGDGNYLPVTKKVTVVVKVK